MAEKSDALDLLKLATDERALDFRQGQWEAIDALVNRRSRLLVVERTGWGKSSVYFIATRILRNRGRGPTLIVSPLLALMRNQIDAADRLGIRALTINSANREDWPKVRRAIRLDEVDALLISPERLSNDEFVENVLLTIAERIGLMVVDEAHCISDWGHDFRPDYKRLVQILQRIPDNVPILGTTATANDRVVEDVRAQLGDLDVQRGPLVRRTLALQNMRLPSQVERLAWLADHIDALPGTGIIYTLTRRDANQVANWLQIRGISAKAYYSGVVSDEFKGSNAYRLHLEKKLLRNEIKALVATTALGMGYDKPDLGFVVHYQAPGSIVAYYQQVGRAGRAIESAIGILMSGDEDAVIHEFFRRSSFPEEEWAIEILGVLEESDGLRVRQLEEAVNLMRGQIDQALKFLSVDSPAPVIKSGYNWQRTPVHYQMDREQIRRLTEKREIEWQEVQEYIEEDRCLMEFLTRALDDVDPHPCGKCASCLRRPLVEVSFQRDTAIAASRFLRQSELDLECNRQVARNGFPQYGFRGNMSGDLRAEKGRILSRWGDAGWGQLVADNKHGGHFSDDIVAAVVEMINDRWKPSPTPKWVTCVPSRNHPDLVPDYAKRLAAALGLEFMPVVEKVKDNEPQKLQQNRYHQCRNLDGVFAIHGSVPGDPVLLVDDVVDSGWTLTVIAALLRMAGSGPVWPLALSTTRMAA